jgi:hypothetical protein
MRPHLKLMQSKDILKIGKDEPRTVCLEGGKRHENFSCYFYYKILLTKTFKYLWDTRGIDKPSMN